MALLFLPMLLRLRTISIFWARPEVVADDPLLQQKSRVSEYAVFYRPRGFLFRGLDRCSGHLLSQWSVEQDRSCRPPTLTQRLQTLSGPGLVLYGLTVTFSADRLGDVAGAALVFDDLSACSSSSATVCGVGLRASASLIFCRGASRWRA